MGFTSLNHLIDLDWLREAYRRTRKDAAAGVDDMTATEYEVNLEERLADLLDRAKSGRYVAPPVKRVYIPKGEGDEKRPIGIPTLEDKILQRAVVMLLEPIYEQDFAVWSYGFRPGRSAHQALEALWQAIMSMGGCWLIDADITKFFDTLGKGHLREIVGHRVRDGVVRRLIGKWLSAGVMEEGVVSYPEAGTPQGGVVAAPTQQITSSSQRKSGMKGSSRSFAPNVGGIADELSHMTYKVIRKSHNNKFDNDRVHQKHQSGVNVDISCPSRNTGIISNRDLRMSDEVLYLCHYEKIIVDRIHKKDQFCGRGFVRGKNSVGREAGFGEEIRNLGKAGVPVSEGCGEHTRASCRAGAETGFHSETADWPHTAHQTRSAEIHEHAERSGGGGIGCLPEDGGEEWEEGETDTVSSLNTAMTGWAFKSLNWLIEFLSLPRICPVRRNCFSKA